ncbi:hypothetical protein BKA93DRAFT_813256 [Sparassis latifolia]
MPYSNDRYSKPCAGTSCSCARTSPLAREDEHRQAKRGMTSPRRRGHLRAKCPRENTLGIPLLDRRGHSSSSSSRRGNAAEGVLAPSSAEWASILSVPRVERREAGSISRASEKLFKKPKSLQYKSRIVNEFSRGTERFRNKSKRALGSPAMSRRSR